MFVTGCLQITKFLATVFKSLALRGKIAKFARGGLGVSRKRRNRLIALARSAVNNFVVLCRKTATAFTQDGDRNEVAAAPVSNLTE